MTKQTETATTETKAVLTGKTLSQAVTKDKDAGIKKSVGFTAPLDKIYVEEGFNIRDLDEEHVASISESYAAGRKVPAIVVKVTEKGLKVIDGHHRYLAAVQAKLEDVNVDEFVGDALAETSFMITSSQGRNLTPLQRANAYQRMIKDGATKVDIHKQTGRSRTDIDRHLLLLEASTAVKKALADGKVGLKAVVSELKRAVKEGGTAADGSKHIMGAIRAANGHQVTTTGMNKYNKSLGIKEEVTEEEAALEKEEKKVNKELSETKSGTESNIDGWTAKDTSDVMEIISGFGDEWLKSADAELVRLVNKWTNLPA